MTKKDYIAIANIIAEADLAQSDREELAKSFAGYLATTNPLFDRHKFLEAAAPQLYDVFHRTWWIENPDYPDGREPGAGEKHYLKYGVSEDEARRTCAQYNKTNDPGPLSDKAEYERA
jgi:hypothetical protein